MGGNAQTRFDRGQVEGLEAADSRADGSRGDASLRSYEGGPRQPDEEEILRLRLRLTARQRRLSLLRVAPKGHEMLRTTVALNLPDDHP